MIRRLYKRWLPIRRRLDRLALPLGLLGLVAVAAYNWRQWQKDKALLAEKGRPPPLPPPEEWPDLPLVSILVAAWNEADIIERHIESFLALRYPHKELVLCAGGCDDTYELAKRYAREQVTVLRQQPGEGKQRALARAFPHTDGDVILLTDADCLLDDDAFEHTIYPIASGQEQVTTGSSRPLPEQLENPFVISQVASQLYSSLYMPDYIDGLLGRNCAVRRDLLQRSRGLEAPAPTGTDYVLAKELLRAGARIHHVPHSRVFTRFPSERAAYMRQQRRWLCNVALHGRRYGAVDEMRASLRTSLLGLVMLLLPAFSLFLAPSALVIWLLVIAHAHLARTRYQHFRFAALDQTSNSMTIGKQVSLLFLDFAAWARPLIDYVQPQKSESW